MEDRVAKPVFAGKDAHGSSLPSRDVVDRCLDRTVRGADDLRVLWRHRDGDASIPVGFDGIARDRARIHVLWKVIGPRAQGPDRTDGKAGFFGSFTVLKTCVIGDH